MHRIFVYSIIFLLTWMGFGSAGAQELEARRTEYVLPLYESTCAEVHEREADDGTRIYSIFLEDHGSIRMSFRPSSQCPEAQASSPDLDEYALTHVVPTVCELVRIETRRESTSCLDVTYPSFSKKDQDLRWKGARFVVAPLRTNDFSVKPLPGNRHLKITLRDPQTEVFLSFENPNCDPVSGFGADSGQGQEPKVILFRPPPGAGYCGQLSVTSRRLDR